MSYKIGGLRDTGMLETDNTQAMYVPLKYNVNIKEQNIKEQNIEEQNIINSKILTEEFIKQLLNSKEYQDKCIKEKKNVEQHKNFKTVKISPLITYNVFDKEKIIDMTPPIGMSIDDCE
jgi:hypothetical protein